MVECSLSSISAMGCNFCRTGSLSFINYNECDKGIQRICFVSRHNVPSGHAHSKWSLTRYNIFVDMTYATTYFLWRTHNWNCFNAVHILDIYIALILSRQSWTRAAKEHSTVFYSLDSWKECVASSARQQVFSSPTVLHSCIVCIGMVVTPTDCNTIINACFPSECLPGRELGAKRKTTCNERCCRRMASLALPGGIGQRTPIPLWEPSRTSLVSRPDAQDVLVQGFILKIFKRVSIGFLSFLMIL